MKNSRYPEIKICDKVIDQVTRFFSQQPYEQGGLIGSSKYLNLIDNFSPVSGTSDQNQFTPDMIEVNKQIACWRNEKICFCGFIHSHLDGGEFLSRSDLIAIERWVLASNLPFLCFGLAIVSSGVVKLKIYLAQKDGNDNVSVKPMQKHCASTETGYSTWRIDYE